MSATSAVIYTLSLHDALPICRALNSEDLPALGRPAITSSAPSRSRSPSGAVARSPAMRSRTARHAAVTRAGLTGPRSEEHTSELQSHSDLVCRLLLEKKKDMM